jgi:hypothetical protein
MGPTEPTWVTTSARTASSYIQATVVCNYSGQCQPGVLLRGEEQMNVVTDHLSQGSASVAIMVAK